MKLINHLRSDEVQFGLQPENTGRTYVEHAAAAMPRRFRAFGEAWSPRFLCAAGPKFAGAFDAIERHRHSSRGLRIRAKGVFHAVSQPGVRRQVVAGGSELATDVCESEARGSERGRTGLLTVGPS